MIQVRGLEKTYGKTKVLHGIDFFVRDNEIFGLLGPNGAGKTTTLEIIEGLKHYQAGTISIDGLDPEQALSAGIIGVQLQSSSLPATMTSKDVMTLFCRWQKKPVRFDLLSRFNLDKVANQTYQTLSTGQKRCLHLALAIARDPRIIILDEPTAGLDIQARAALHEEILKMKADGVTMILASHDLAEVEKLCDRVAILVEGRIKKIGTPEEITAEIKREVVLKVQVKNEQAMPTFQHLTPIVFEGVHWHFRLGNILEGLEELITFIRQSNNELLDITLEKPTLEARFLEIAKGGGL
ncbi:MAG: ABC transporter ATP-binding protein [Acholeplasmatales bacterium]|nr:MAG: ABC transporter ATP-binding protein [Acholeplasmatales bacterium]